MAIIYRGMLAIYLVVLTWLIVLKTSFSISTLLAHNHQRKLNLVPFGAPSMVNGQINYNEMIFNCLLFIPFGLLLSVNFKRLNFFSKLSIVLIFSAGVEITQYVFAIGVTDITDVITNTLGGLIGLSFYGLASRYIKSDKLDRIVISVGLLLLLLFISLSGHYVRTKWR